MFKPLLLAAALGVSLLASAQAAIPRFDHVVIVIMENHDEAEIIGNASAPYLTSLANGGANFTNAHGVDHPSQPNYVALFSGSTQGVSNDNCPQNLGSKNNLSAQLRAAGLSFTGFSEDIPSVGYTGCGSGNYARKHNPWVDFSNLPTSVNQAFSSFPSDFTKLPTVSIVVPNLCNDMHNCSVKTGDNWVKQKMDAYAQWAKTHNSLLIVTFDEDDSSTTNNLIPTLFYGAKVKTGKYTNYLDHYGTLATIESMYGLSPLSGGSAMTSCWQ